MDIMNDVDLTILTCNDILMENRFAVCLKFAFSPFPVIHFGKIFKFTNFPFKAKYNNNNTAVYFANSNYLFSSGKQETKIAGINL